jgi:cyclase
MMMNRRNFIENSTYSAFAVYLSSIGLSACSKKTNYSMLKNIAEDKPYKMSLIRGKVGYFKEKGGTIGWMIDGGNSVVVDTQFPEQAAHLIEEHNKLTDAKIEALFNTHHHGDHTSGNIKFKGLTDKIITHTNSLKHQKEGAEKNNTLANVLLPNTTFDDTYKIKVGHENIKCHYFGAAHTDGDIVIHFEDSNVMHIGDLVFNRRFPFIDKSAGASISNWITVLDKTAAHADKETIFICGHCSEGYDIVINKSDIAAFQNYLAKLIDLGQKSIASGKTKEQVVAENKVIPGAEEWKGDGITRSIDAIYIELNK